MLKAWLSIKASRQHSWHQGKHQASRQQASGIKATLVLKAWLSARASGLSLCRASPCAYTRSDAHIPRNRYPHIPEIEPPCPGSNKTRWSTLTVHHSVLQAHAHIPDATVSERHTPPPPVLLVPNRAPPPAHAQPRPWLAASRQRRAEPVCSFRAHLGQDALWRNWRHL